jgi:hypothetical protein
MAEHPHVEKSEIEKKSEVPQHVRKDITTQHSPSIIVLRILWHCRNPGHDDSLQKWKTNVLRSYAFLPPAAVFFLAVPAILHLCCLGFKLRLLPLFVCHVTPPGTCYSRNYQIVILEAVVH